MTITSVPTSKIIKSNVVGIPTDINKEQILLKMIGFREIRPSDVWIIDL